MEDGLKIRIANRLKCNPSNLNQQIIEPTKLELSMALLIPSSTEPLLYKVSDCVMSTLELSQLTILFFVYNWT